MSDEENDLEENASALLDLDEEIFDELDLIAREEEEFDDKDDLDDEDEEIFDELDLIAREEEEEEFDFYNDEDDF